MESRVTPGAHRASRTGRLAAALSAGLAATLVLPASGNPILNALQSAAATRPATEPATQPATRPADATQPTQPTQSADDAMAAAAQQMAAMMGDPYADIPPEVLAQLQASGQLPPGMGGADASQAGPLAAAIEQRPFQRTPDALLAALRGDGGEEPQAETPEEGTEPDPNAQAAAFEADVLAGRWQTVSDFLEPLEPDQAAAIYTVVLNKLAAGGNDPRRQQQYYDPYGQPQQPQGQGLLTMLPDDVLGLAGAYPHEPTNAHIAPLGQLLTAAFKQYRGQPQAVESLESGRGRFGGEQAEDRLRAADLLVAAGLPSEAKPFLPPVTDDTDAAVLNRHAKVLVAEGDAALLDAALPPGAGISVEELRQLYEMYGWPVPANLAQTEAGVTLAPEHARALELSGLAIERADAGSPPMAEAIDRAMSLLLRVDETDAEAFLAKHAADASLDGAVVGALATRVAAGGEQPTSEREKTLRLQSFVAHHLLEHAGEDAAVALRLFAQNWLQEVARAEQTPSAKQQARDQNQRQGSIRLQMPGGGYTTVSRSYSRSRRGSDAGLPDNALVKNAPADADATDLRWLDAAGEDLRPALLRAMAVVLTRDEQFDAALDYVERLAGLEPAAAHEAAKSLLTTWGSATNPNPPAPDESTSYYAAQQQQGGGGIPMTRTRQGRNLAELREMLDRFDAMPIEPMSPALIARAFMDAHSNAEVFRNEDLEAVLGSLGELDGDAALALMKAMRERLVNQWRQPATQAQAGTKRDDEAIAAEVERGYGLLIDFADRRAGDDWRIALLSAASRFDRNEFRYGRGMDLAVYTAERDAAFDRFRAAAEQYGRAVTDGEIARQSQTAEPYMTWFLASLGASDLAQLTRQQAPRTQEAAAVAEMMAQLPEDAAQRHVDLFAAALTQQAATVPPQLKDRYFRAGLNVVGDDHPDAREAAQLVQQYDDLLEEIELYARLDADTTQVGQEPFGVHLGVRHTDSVGRESGGFGRYLMQPGAPNPYMMVQQAGNRDTFEQGIREALVDGFEIISITWHAADVQPRGDPAGEPGWRVTPLAFLTLRATDPAIDRLPPMELNLNFADSSGEVVLPVRTPVVAVDARTTPPIGSGELSGLTVTQTLDESKRGEGVLTLDIRAEATGLVPAMPRLLDDAPPAGWTQANSAGGDLLITGLDLDSPRVRPTSERSWSMTFEPADGTEGASQTAFAFLPALPALGEVDTTFQRYSGNDLVDVSREVTFASAKERGPSGWLVAGLIAAGLAVVALAGFVVWRLLRSGGSGEARRSALPRDLTPFTLLAALRRLEGDGSLNGDTGRLREDIRRLEQAHFASGDPGAAQDELQPIARRWLAHR